MPGQGISVGSQRNFSNNFIVDGLSANDDAAGLSGIPYGVDAVDQFQVVTSGGQAELGRALGGYVNVVTQERHQPLHGDRVRLSCATTASTRANALSGTTLPMTQQQYGAQPRRADRPGPHVLLRELRAAAARSDRPVTIAPANVPRHQRAAGGRRISGRSRSTTGVYPNPVHSTNLLGQGRSPDQRPRSVQRALQPVRRHVRQLARRRRR